MANPHYLEIIRKGPVEWNRWRIDNDVIRPKLAVAVPSEAILSKAEPSRVDLTAADLIRTNLIGANLRRVDLSRATLIGASLGWADLGSAILAETNLFTADLSHALLNGAELSNAFISIANLGRANLSGAKLRSATFRGANLTEANLSHSDLTWANLSKTNLTGADLSGADLSGATLSNTIFANTNLTGTKGLENCQHQGPSVLDYQTLAQSGQLPLAFLRGCGLPDVFIEYLPSLLSHGIEFYSCFISYSHQDKPFARRLHDTLQGRGIRCWLDEKQLRGGDDILDHVDRGIRLWDKVLLCCSKNSLTSGWVETELDKALEKEQTLRKERQEKVLAIIPLDLDGYLFNGWQSSRATDVRKRLAIDFNGWKESHTKCEEKIEEVIRALRSGEQARELPPKPKL